MGRYRSLLLAGACLLPILLLRDFTPANELRYLSIADEALRDGHLFAFYNHGVPYADKPPLYLWLVMLLRLVSGAHRMWLLGLLSLVPALAVCHVVTRWAERVLPAYPSATARLLMMTGGLFAGAAIMLRMDMLMTLFVVLALRECFLLTRQPAAGSQALLGLYTFLALFTKGPMGILVPLSVSAVYLLLRGCGRHFSGCWGWRAWTVIGAGCMLWWAAAWREGGAGYIGNLLFHQTVDRAVDAFHHKQPVYYYMYTLWYILAPWSPLLAWACWRYCRRRAWRALDAAGRDALCFFTVAATVPIAVLSLVSGKIEIYTLPALPFILALGAHCMGAVAGGGFLRGVRLASCGLLVTVFLAAWTLPLWNDRLGYAALCREARQKATPATQYYTWRVSRSENMDVYLHRPVTPLGSATAAAALRGADLLMCPATETPRFTHMEQAGAAGKYVILQTVKE